MINNAHLPLKQLSKNLTATEIILVTNPTNIYYLTNFRTFSLNLHEAYLVIFCNQTYLFTYFVNLENAQKFNNIAKIVEISNYRDFIKKLKKLTNTTKINKLYLEENNVWFNEYRLLKKSFPRVNFLTTKRIDKLRSLKTPKEIKSIRKACLITDKCYEFILKYIKTGITEELLSKKIRLFFIKKGLDIAFPPIVAFGTNSSNPHHIPSKAKILKKESVILLDIGTQLDGYCSDMTRTLYFGKNPSKTIQKAYKTVQIAQNKAIDILTSQKVPFYNKKKEGYSGKMLDKLAKSVINKTGFKPYKHSLGHSIGLEIHEYPKLTEKRDALITPQMVFSIEPAIYVPNEFGIRIEDTVYLDDQGLEILTKSPKSFMIR
ncbi:M24 family metallopeptidase [Patescibacteria group bacterium]